MDGIALPATVLLYILSATTVTNYIINGIRTHFSVHPGVAFFGAILVGIGSILLFLVANDVALTPSLYAAAVLAGVLAGGGSAGVNVVHNRTLPTKTGV